MEPCRSVGADDPCGWTAVLQLRTTSRSASVSPPPPIEGSHRCRIGEPSIAVWNNRLREHRRPLVAYPLPVALDDRGRHIRRRRRSRRPVHRSARSHALAGPLRDGSDPGPRRQPARWTRVRSRSTPHRAATRTRPPRSVISGNTTGDIGSGTPEDADIEGPLTRKSPGLSRGTLGRMRQPARATGPGSAVQVRRQPNRPSTSLVLLMRA
jgi:hypothetical protein